MFKTQAINAQGTILSISDGTGTQIADITAVTKAPQAVVSSVSATAVVGDVVQFGTVTGMPEINGQMGVVTDAIAGTSFTVDIDSSGFAAAGTAGTATQVVWVAGCETKTFSGFDGQAAEVDVTTLCSTAREFLQGLQDFGAFNFEVNLVPNDPFQQECLEARAAREKRVFKLQFPPDEQDKSYAYIFEAFVRQFSIAGGVDQPVTGNVVLRVTGEPVLVES